MIRHICLDTCTNRYINNQTFHLFNNKMINHRLGKLCQDGQQHRECPVLPGQLARHVQPWHQLPRVKPASVWREVQCQTQPPATTRQYRYQHRVWAALEGKNNTEKCVDAWKCLEVWRSMGMYWECRKAGREFGEEEEDITANWNQGGRHNEGQFQNSWKRCIKAIQKFTFSGTWVKRLLWIFKTRYRKAESTYKYIF